MTYIYVNTHINVIPPVLLFYPNRYRSRSLQKRMKFSLTTNNRYSIISPNLIPRRRANTHPNNLRAREY